jgi:hypothetical protein
LAVVFLAAGAFAVAGFAAFFSAAGLASAFTFTGLAVLTARTVVTMPSSRWRAMVLMRAMSSFSVFSFFRPSLLPRLF